MGRRGSSLARIGAVIGLTALVAGVRALPAAAVPPELTLPPERLYTLVDTPIAFTGSDPLSGDDRALVVTVTDDGCAPSGNNTWSLDGCARVQMSVSHGQLAVPLETNLGSAGEPDGIAPGGAIVDGSTDGDGTGLVVNLNGTQSQLNDALALLTYTPDSGYEYDGTNPESLGILVADGTTPADNVSHGVEIFVQQLNDGPDLTVPSEVAVAAGGTVSVPAVEPPVGTNGDMFVEDPDITEGEGDDEMLVAMIATCGQFSLRGGALTLGATIEDLLAAEGVPQLAIDAILAALPSEVTSQMFATGSPTDPHQALAAVAEYDELNYALSQVDFTAPATDGRCDLFTIVTDLGNNGLPFQYVGSPLGGRDLPQPGVELPDLGLDFDVTSFVVGQGVELSVPTALSVTEGDTLAIPVSTSSPNHPGIELGVTSTGITADSLVDFAPPASPVVFPENDPGPLGIDLLAIEDADDEPDQTLTVTIDLGGMAPGITVTNATVTVTIVDDDDAPSDTTSPTVTIEQAAGQTDPASMSPIRFDAVFSEPVTGFTAADVTLAGTAAGPPTVSAVMGSGTTYTVEVTGMTTAGTVIATIPAGAAMDAAGNTNLASTSLDNTVTWNPPPPDTTWPIGTIDEAPGQSDPTSTSPITFRITFDEPVTGLAAADIDTSSSTAGGPLAVTVTEIDATTYDVEVTGMTTAGDVTTYLPASTVTDLAGNPNDTTTVVDDTVEWTPPPDVTAPTVTVEQAVGQADPTSLAPVLFTVEFSEPVTGFDEADLDLGASTVGGTLSAVISGAGPSYEVAVSGMTTVGDVVLDVPAGAAADGAGNDSLASTSTDNVVAWVEPDPGDATMPTVTVEQAAGQADPTSVAPVHFVVTFSEPVTGFDVADLRLDGTTVGGDLLGDVGVRRRADGQAFDVLLTGMTTTGDVVLSVVGGAAADGTGNPSLASTSVDNVVRWLDQITVDVDVDGDGTIDDPSIGYTYDGYGGTTYGGGDGFLARTGVDIAGLLVLGAGVVGLGLGLVLVARRPWGHTG